MTEKDFDYSRFTLRSNSIAAKQRTLFLTFDRYDGYVLKINQE